MFYTQMVLGMPGNALSPSYWLFIAFFSGFFSQDVKQKNAAWLRRILHVQELSVFLYIFLLNILIDRLPVS